MKNTLNKFMQTDIYSMFDDVRNMYTGVAIVELDCKYNFIDMNSKLLYDTWFDYIEDEFIDGFARVSIDNKHNLITEYGKLVLPRFVDKIYEFYGEKDTNVPYEDARSYINFKLDNELYRVNDHGVIEKYIKRKGWIKTEIR